MLLYHWILMSWCACGDAATDITLYEVSNNWWHWLMFRKNEKVVKEVSLPRTQVAGPTGGASIDPMRLSLKEDSKAFANGLSALANHLQDLKAQGKPDHLNFGPDIPWNGLHQKYAILHGVKACHLPALNQEPSTAELILLEKTQSFVTADSDKVGKEQVFIWVPVIYNDCHCTYRKITGVYDVTACKTLSGALPPRVSPENPPHPSSQAQRAFSKDVAENGIAPTPPQTDAAPHHATPHTLTDSSAAPLGGEPVAAGYRLGSQPPVGTVTPARSAQIGRHHTQPASPTPGGAVGSPGDAAPQESVGVSHSSIPSDGAGSSAPSHADVAPPSFT